MKKVRFESPNATEAEVFVMRDSECHSPRPFMERETWAAPELCYDVPINLPYNADPVQRFECSNASPYPAVNRMPIGLPEQQPLWKPSDDLNLSLLDASSHEPHQPIQRAVLKNTFENRICGNSLNNMQPNRPQVLASIENSALPPNVLVKDNSFFIRRDKLEKYHMNINPLHNQFNRISIGKENDPIVQKSEIMKNGVFQQIPAYTLNAEPVAIKPIIKTNVQAEPKFMELAEDICPCHHCAKTLKYTPKCPTLLQETCNPVLTDKHRHTPFQISGHMHCQCFPLPKTCSSCVEPVRNFPQHNCQSPVPQNTVERKTRAIEKLEQKKLSDCMEVEKQTNVTKEKREPTVADLFKIIKLQNEQLQMLQEKVDKFILQQNTPTVSCSGQSDKEQLKMSIGIMTSFEMVRTSTVINKEVVKQTNENQIQCNLSQISIQEVVTKPAMNFLDGIMPVNNPPENKNQMGIDKTLNELSLCNVQVDNATTPNLSPEQTLYLDVRDYSESDTSSNDQSNVGWTYYNKVMTHVNGMLQDSEMPSSASAMFRNVRQQCVGMQMQIDKSNISVTKRVKFGDDPLGIRQPHLYPTDTSLKMNQLAAKYLNNAPAPAARVLPRPAAPVDMSFATRNYMERHKLLQGNLSTKSPQNEIPRFLDITALKQQPKFL